MLTIQERLILDMYLHGDADTPIEDVAERFGVTVEYIEELFQEKGGLL